MKGKLGKVVNWAKYNLNWVLHYYLYRKPRTPGCHYNSKCKQMLSGNK